MAIKIVSKRDVFFYLCCVLFCSLAGFLSPFYWVFDLFTHFRPQAILAGLIGLPVAWFLKDRRSVVIAILVVVLNGAVVGKRLYDFSPSTQARTTGTYTSLITANVHKDNRDYGAVIGLLKVQQPDIFIAIEVDSAWVDALKEIEAVYPHSLKDPREDNFGMAVYSKKPFKGEALEFGNFGVPLLRADFSAFTLFALHPPPPAQAKIAAELELYLGEMQKRAEKVERPLVVTGDMNTTLWSDNAKFFKAAGLVSPSAGLAWTWPTGFFPLAIQIDHIFTRGCGIKSFATLENIGSDHYPVKAEIAVP